MDTRRRLLLSGANLLPLVIWDGTMSSVEQIPVSYTVEGGSGASIEVSSISTSSWSGMTLLLIKSGAKSTVLTFTIPAKYIKAAKTITVYWRSSMTADSCAFTCGSNSQSDSGAGYNLTKTTTFDVSTYAADATIKITATGSNTRVYELILT